MVSKQCLWWILMVIKFTCNKLHTIFVSYATLHKKWSFPLRISSVNVTKSTVSFGFGYILLKKSLMANFISCAVQETIFLVKFLIKANEIVKKAEINIMVNWELYFHTTSTIFDFPFFCIVTVVFYFVTLASNANFRSGYIFQPIAEQINGLVSI